MVCGSHIANGQSRTGPVMGFQTLILISRLRFKGLYGCLLHALNMAIKEFFRDIGIQVPGHSHSPWQCGIW